MEAALSALTARLNVPEQPWRVIDQKGFIAMLLKVQVAAGLAFDTGRKDRKGEPVYRPRYDWHHLRHVAASNWLNDGN